MADSSVNTGVSGVPLRLLTALGTASAGQQVMTLADSSGAFLGVPGNPMSMVRLDATTAVSIAANGASSGSVTGLNGKSVGTVHLTGTWVATVQIQVTGDGSTWVNLTGSNVVTNAATGAYVTGGSITAVGAYQIDLSGFAGVRVITTAYTSGTITGIVRASDGVGAVAIEGVPAVTVTGSATVNASSNNIGSVGVLSSTGGTGVFYVSTGTNAVQVAKASAGNLQNLTIANTAASTQWVKFYNATTATIGSTALAIDIPVTAGQTLALPMGANGQRFTTGICFAIVGATGAGTTANASGVYVALTYV